jgi:hypothetical protein
LVQVTGGAGRGAVILSYPLCAKCLFENVLGGSHVEKTHAGIAAVEFYFGQIEITNKNGSEYMVQVEEFVSEALISIHLYMNRLSHDGNELSYSGLNKLVADFNIFPVMIDINCLDTEILRLE